VNIVFVSGWIGSCSSLKLTLNGRMSGNVTNVVRCSCAIVELLPLSLLLQELNMSLPLVSIDLYKHFVALT
jgi:hypothetical protein